MRIWSVVYIGMCFCCFLCPSGYASVSPLYESDASSYLDGIEPLAIAHQPISSPNSVPVVAQTTDTYLEEQALAVDYITDIEQELELLSDCYVSDTQVAGQFDSLKECMDTAVEQHLPLQIAHDKISLSRRKVFKSIRELFPALSASYEHDLGFKLIKADAQNDQSSQQFRSERVTGQVSQPIFRGGALWNQVKAEKAGCNVAEAEYNKVFHELLLESAKVYFNLLKAQTMLGYKKELRTKVRELFSLSQEKKAAELVSEIEMLNVEAQKNQVEHDVEAVREEVELATIEFKKVLHVDVNVPVKVGDFESLYVDAVEKEVSAVSDDIKELSEKEKEKKLNELMKLAYQHRPEFVIYKKKQEHMSWLEKVASSGWLPQINVVMSKGKKAEAYKLDDNSPPWDDEHHVGLEIKWNIGGNTAQYVYDKNRQGTGVEAVEPIVGIGTDGYYDRKNIGSVSLLDGLEQFALTKDAQIRHQEAMLELEQSEKDIVSEVKEAYFGYHRALIQVKSSLKRLEYRHKLYELAAHKSEINEIQISEFIQAAQDLLNERESLYRAVIDYMVAKVSINKAIGIRDYFPIEKI